MHQTLRNMRQKRADGEHGFTLIELLVVVVIIGVLVAIAIPVYLNYRKGAENKSAQSDVRNAVIAIEQCYTEIGADYPATMPMSAAGASVILVCAPGANQTINVSPGNTLAYTRLSATSFTVSAGNQDTAPKRYTYASTTGKIT